MQTVRPEEFLNTFLSTGTTVIDVRTYDEFHSKHIPGSINIPVDEVEKERDRLPQSGPFYVICKTGRRSSKACEAMEKMGLNNAIGVEGGIIGFEAIGGSTVSDLPPLSVMRQVQLTAGTLVMAGTLLGAFVNPAFLALSGFVGAGFIVAGATGTCGMAHLLGKMPWNKKAMQSTQGASCCQI